MNKEERKEKLKELSIQETIMLILYEAATIGSEKGGLSLDDVENLMGAIDDKIEQYKNMMSNSLEV